MSLLTLRQSPSARIAHLLVIEGLAYAFTDTPSIAGTSYLDEGREVLPGLELPSAIRVGINEREGLLKEYSVEFGVMDTPDNKVASLFRGLFDDSTSDQLLARIKPTDDPVGSSLYGSINPRNRHLGVEMFGPSGERRYRYIHPGTPPPGLDHVWVGNEAAVSYHPRLLVTDEPRVFAGRRVALHELVWDPVAESWGTWSDQYDSGSLVWTGTMQGRGEIVATAQWRILCDGPASITRRLLNRHRAPRAYKVSPRIVVDDAQKGVGVIFKKSSLFGVGGTNFKSRVFDDADDIAAVTNETLRTELNTLIDDVAAGNTPNFADLGDEFDNADNHGSAQVNNDSISIKFNAQGASEVGRMGLIMHEKFWALLGFDPATQSTLTIDSELYIKFVPLGPSGTVPELGTNLLSYRDSSATALDPDGYWAMIIQNAPYIPPIGFTPGLGAYPFPMIFPGGVISVSPNARQEVSLAAGDKVYAPSQKCFPPGGTYGDAEDRPSIGLTKVNAMGWWWLRGQIARGVDQFAEVEFEDFNQVARCSWVVDSADTMSEQDGLATMVIEHLEDPRAFGFESEKIKEPWLSGGTTTLEAIPLGVFAYRGATSQSTVPDAAYRLIPRILLSSGTSGTWGTSGPPTHPSLGDNQPTLGNAADKLSGDTEIADLGIGLEGDQVDLISFRELHERTLGSPYNRLGLGKYAYARPVQGEEILGSLLQGRGWSFGWLRRPGYKQPKWAGVDLYSPAELSDIAVLTGDALLHITESDLAGDPTDNTSWIPKVEQTWRSPVDSFDVSCRSELDTDSMTFDAKKLALDSGSPLRHGATSLGIKDDGLSNPSLFSADSEYHWHQAFLQRWQSHCATWLAKPHRVVTLNVSAPKGQWLYPGQYFLLTNAAINSLDGQSIGVSQAQCVVTDLTMHKRGKLMGNYTVRAVMLGIPTVYGFPKVWAGSAKVTTTTDNGGGSYTFACESDWLGIGHGGEDLGAFVEPAWSTVGGSIKVKIFQSFDHATWPTANVVTATVSSISVSSLLVTGASGTVYDDTLKIIVPADYGDQDADSWTRELIMFHADDDGDTHTSGTAGTKLG